MKKIWGIPVLALAAALTLPAAENPVATKTEAPAAAAEAQSPESIPVPTIAVLPFSSRGARIQNEEMGKSIADLVTVTMMGKGEFDLVDRSELDKTLTELHLSSTGLVDTETRLNLGRLVGARVLITGSVFVSGDKNYIIAKVIGTETGRVLAAASSGTADAADLVPELCDKVAVLLQEKGNVILPPPRTVLTVAGKLSPLVKGNGRKVYVKVAETIGMPAVDPAAETELKKLFVTLGFAVVDSRSEADFSLLGEGIAADSGSYQQFSSSTARVELTLYKGKDQVLAVDRQKETVAGPSYVIAAKDALGAAALTLASRMLPALK
ncbi:MAG: hypothetical protein HPZ91_00915 [Lentisphaeria bacterium]|nr:hypothetical protein [Lentisphaeria bacterium]